MPNTATLTVMLLGSTSQGLAVPHYPEMYLILQQSNSPFLVFASTLDIQMLHQFYNIIL